MARRSAGQTNFHVDLSSSTGTLIADDKQTTGTDVVPHGLRAPSQTLLIDPRVLDVAFEPKSICSSAFHDRIRDYQHTLPKLSASILLEAAGTTRKGNTLDADSSCLYRQSERKGAI